jgi:hypothetical protein
MGIREYLESYVASGDGPMIYHDDETWQDDLDTVCRKLYKYLTATYKQINSDARFAIAPFAPVILRGSPKGKELKP